MEAFRVNPSEDHLESRAEAGYIEQKDMFAGEYLTNGNRDHNFMCRFFRPVPGDAELFKEFRANDKMLMYAIEDRPELVICCRLLSCPVPIESSRPRVIPRAGGRGSFSGALG